MKIYLSVSAQNSPIYGEVLQKKGFLLTEEDPDLVIQETGCTIEHLPEIPLLTVKDSQQLETILTHLENKNPLNAFLLQKEESVELLPCEQAYFFDARDDHVFCYSAEGCWEVKLKLYEIDEQYRSRGFIRISKSTVINTLAVREVVPWFGGRILLRFFETDEIREVSRRYTGSFKAYLRMKT